MSDLTPMRIGDELITTDEAIEVRSPYDDRLLGRVPKATAAHIDHAVAVAKATLAGGPLPAYQRAEILDAAAVALAAQHERFAQLVSTEAAKPISQARGETTRALDTIRFSAAVARTMGGDLLSLDASSAGLGKVGYVKRVPIGVVAGVSPFNFPLNLVCHKVMPAIAAGAPVVLKPASSTPLTALALVELLVGECGLPPGWLSVVTCPGSVADHLVTHDDVAMVTFTGSPEVGWSIRSRAARKKVSLELGNNSPIIIEPDGDWAAAAAKIKIAGFSFAGQSCISTQRLLVHESIAADFTAELVRQVATLVVGDPADDATHVSALIDRGETERVKAWIDDAAAEGGTVACGGTIGADGVLAPTVITDATPAMAVCAKEVFGPVVTVTTYDDLDDAFAMANDTDYGLQAAIFTANLATALRAADVLDFGGVIVNEVPTWRADHMPYGGIRDSGNTREGPAYAAREMTEERLIVLQGTA